MTEEPRKPKSRWSTGKYRNPDIPAYIPPEAFLMADGDLLQAIELRATLHDLNRMIVSPGVPEDHFAMGGWKIDPTYDHQGRRNNTPADLLQQRQGAQLRRIHDALKRHLAKMEDANQDREIIKKIYFTEAQMEQKMGGAILGARGATHQMLERKTGCKIVLAGRGLTDTSKRDRHNSDRFGDIDSLAREPPHVRLTAPSENALNKGAAEIEWILSDRYDAQVFREERRKELAILEGKYNPDTWESSVTGQPDEGLPTHRRRQENGAEKAEGGVVEDEVADLMDMI